MAEYIEKTQLIEKLKHRVSTNDDSKFATGFIKGTNEALGIIEEWIASIPAAADVAPVVHGRWVYNPNGMDWNLGAWQCSVCKCNNNNLPGNDKHNPYIFQGSNYCPNCGAKMDEEENDNV